ncbi:MAG: ATP-binding protein, partial [Ruthenibacterium sp.]
VDADPDLLSRVIHNLLSNALHHVGADGYLAVRCLPEAGGGARVEVCDHGEGISPEDLPSIFDKYYRTRASAGKPGTGLGLSITKAILQGHGFDFGVQSEVGRGSTFWFRAK